MKMRTMPTPASAITPGKVSFFPSVCWWMALWLLVSALLTLP